MALADEARVYQRSLRRAGLQRSMGAFYTPEWMVETLLDHALEPVLDAHPHPIRICDPACGAGIFLVGAAKRLERRGRTGDTLLGIDLDPFALELTRRSFLAEGLPEPQTLLANALEEPPQGIDVFLGNPPFQNVIGRKEPSPTLKNFPLLGGTADLAFEFLAMAHEAVSPTGRVGFVLPRTALNAPSAQALREAMHPRLIQTPPSANYFCGANIFVTLVVTGEPGPCLTDSGIMLNEDSNWWRLAAGVAPVLDGPRLGDHFEVSASLTTGDAYEIRALLAEDGPGFRLITTGLIDPGTHQWGARICRFLGGNYLRPTLDPALLTGALAQRCERARRPKIVVAGLSSRIEAYLDSNGSTLGSVSTYSIFHPEDDCGALQRLLDVLLCDAATRYFRAELGANAMGGGSITMTKLFLKGLPMGILI